MSGFVLLGFASFAVHEAEVVPGVPTILALLLHGVGLVILANLLFKRRPHGAERPRGRVVEGGANIRYCDGAQIAL
jgi:hypothetical protein